MMTDFSKSFLEERITLYKQDLLNDIVPFWIKHAVDHEDGGFTFCLNRDGGIIDTDKGIWQTGRFTWLLATLCNEIEPKEEWLSLARHGANFLDRYGFDEDGKMFFIVDKKGNPVRKRRYAYSESFTAIANAALYKATKEEFYAERAMQLFHNYRKLIHEPGIFPPKFSMHRNMKGIGTLMIGIVTAQELRKNLNDTTYTQYIHSCIDEISQNFMKSEFEALMENVAADGSFIDHFDGRILNPGHALEAAWFILEEARVNHHNPSLIELGTTILDWMWRWGWDQEYGGIFYFRDVKGLPVTEYWHDMKFWWPQNEAIIATLLAYELTQDPKYANWYQLIHDWVFEHFPDRQYGEWFGYLHRDGRLSTPLKGNIWKGPFHIPRMYLMAWQIMERIKEKF
ncbi:AGE family epimerase/isomerase [Fulvivirgaceae bacterium BMA10]|uniref:AGE family epimerase/isomerase n=1 Tax=Splendidivirga corallicola TaxID=3051826 RepID=A0ABT8KHE2_9BACT|nr:AGE family epimerase/isomerase [Fulvivirgaceae bacterium BMA10]